VLAVLQSPQPLSTESILTALLNEITTNPEDLIPALPELNQFEGYSSFDRNSFSS
jgi:hypothetical protein